MKLSLLVSALSLIPFLNVSSASAINKVRAPSIEENYSESPTEVAWQRKSGEDLLFKSELCGKKVTYCFAYLTAGPGQVRAAICRGEEETGADGKVQYHCPKDPALCGENDRTVTSHRDLFGEVLLGDRTSHPNSTQPDTGDKRAREIGN